MPIDGVVFTALSGELQRDLVNARVQDVFSPQSDELVVQLRQPGRTLHLIASIDARMGRLHLTRRQLPKAATPPAFSLLLRKHLIPGRVLEVRQEPMERVLTVVIEGYGTDGGRSERHLIYEIMGRHSNIVLVDGQSGLILDALRRIPHGANSYREILPHRPYVPPPAQDKASPFDITFEQFDALVRHVGAQVPVTKTLQGALMGFGPLAATELVAGAGLPLDTTRGALTFEGIDRLWHALQAMVEALRQGRISPTKVEGTDFVDFWCFEPRTLHGRISTFDTVSTLLEDVFEKRVAAADFERRHKQLTQLVDRHLARLQRKIERQKAELDAAQEADTYKQYGDLITSNLYRLDDTAVKAPTIELLNFYNEGEPIEVAVDPQLTPAQNAQAYYRRYQKARKTMTLAKEHLEASKAEKAYLDTILLALDIATDVTALTEIETELQREGYIDRREDGSRIAPGSKASVRRDEEALSEPLRYRSGDGFLILVGRNNRQNDEITLRRAKPDDVWLHTKDIPGAHVVVVSGGRHIPEGTVMEAASLAAHHSKAKLSSNVPVDVTLRKHVRKPKGAKPGMVIYDHHQTVWVTPGKQPLPALISAKSDEGSDR